MPISTIVNGETGSSVRTKLNSVIGAVNLLGSAANSSTTDFATAAQGAKADTAVQGSTGAADNAILRADGTGGKTTQASGISIDDLDNVAGVESIAAKGSGGMTLKTSAGATIATFGAGGATVTLPSGTNIGNVSATELGYLDGVTSAIQTQLDAKAASSAVITIAGNSTALGGSVTQDQITGLASTGLVKRTASNTLAIATPSTDYCPATSGSGILKGSSGGTATASAGTDYVAPGAITTSGLTMATARLLGRTTASTGAPEEIIVGTGLSMSGGTLSSTVTGGKILQVIQATKTDTASVTGTTFTSVSLSASITPSSSTSKILVLASISAGSAASQQALFRLTRGGSVVFQGDSAGSRKQTTSSQGVIQAATITTIPLMYLDSPATTSSVTYDIELASNTSGSVFVNRSSTDTDSATFVRAASSIILMEVAA